MTKITSTRHNPATTLDITANLRRLSFHGKSLFQLHGSDLHLISLILLTAALNHLLTFLAYDWYAGIDAYSYDVAGFQLVTGLILDPYPLMFRAPLVPIIKNLLYLLFEGHQVLFGVFLHTLGIATTYLAWRLGRRFSRVAGATAGMFMALSLPISVHFHHLSVTTIYIPLLILTADQFIVWIRKPGRTNSSVLALLVLLCCMTRVEAVALIPIFALSGWVAKISKKQLAIFFGISFLLYNLSCLFYFNTFGYWGITKNTGYSLFFRTAYPENRFFSETNGPASKQIGKYLHSAQAIEVSGGNIYDGIMLALNLAQDDLGFSEADQLFLRAGIEGIKSRPVDFLKDTSLRFLGQMDIYDPGLRHKDYSSETESGHMWGYGEERIRTKPVDRAEFVKTQLQLSNLASPLVWERKYIKARFINAIGFKDNVPPLPPEFQMSSNIHKTQEGTYYLNTGGCVLAVRTSIVHAFDYFFFWSYWGEGNWSPNALKILAGWDRILPTGILRHCLHFAMWVLWFAAIVMTGDRKNQIFLTAFLSFVIFSDLCQVIFSDNYGGRFFFFTVIFLWIGGSTGIETLMRRLKVQNESR
jgi:hypothetical protein